MALIAAAVVGSAYVSYRSAKETAKAASQAGETQAAAAEKALQFQKEQYADIKPYLMQSLQGYQGLLEQPESFKQTPGYLFRLQEGLKSIGIPEGSKNLSGPQLQAAIKYSQDYATGEYSNALRRIAGLGELAQGVSSVGSQYANQMGNILQNQAGYRAQATQNVAAARASGYAGMANAIGQGFGMYQQRQLQSPQQQTVQPGGWV